MTHEKYTITGMTCSACSSRVQKCVAKLDGTTDVSVNLLTNSMQVTYDETKLTSPAIIDSVIQAGYGASLAGSPGQDKTAGKDSAIAAADTEIRNMKTRLWGSIAFLIPTMYIAMHHMFLEWFGLPVPVWFQQLFHGPENAIAFSFSQFLLILPIMYLNRKYYQNGLRNLFHGAPNMDSLIAIGSGASALFGIFAIFRIGFGLGHGDWALVNEYSSNLYFESAGMIVTLITVGKYLESKSKGKTSEAITKLMDLAPKQAQVMRDGTEKTIPVEDLIVGDEIIVRPGESIPVDGIITDGTTSIDEAAITGESIPIEKRPGDTVTSATLNKTGCIHITANRVGEDTTISQIIHLVDEASASKAPIAKLADTIAGIFVPAVMAIAVIAAVIWYISGATFEFSFSIGIAILVISCPCALGLATPVAIMVGTGKGAENGILIKSGDALETAHAIDTVVMDKTGTITTGQPRVTDIKATGPDEATLLAIATGLERGSEHPLAEAILRYAAEMKISPMPIENFQAVFGRGIQGTSSNTTYYAGNAAFLQEQHIDTTPLESQLNAWADDGKTPLLFAQDTTLIGSIAVADTEKPGSAAAIDAFKKMGIDVVMLTGDTLRTAMAIKNRLHIPKVIAGVLPQDKEKHVAELQAQGHKVAMIGDGINDAPALARADLGIAIGAGTDVAIESADAVLIRSDLLDAVSAIRLSKAVITNIKENLFWAFFYNIIGIPLAAGLLYPSLGIKLSPMIGAAAMSMSSVCVVLNALRLRFFKTNHITADVSRETLPPISSPILQKEEVSTMKTELKIEGMMCMHCQKHVQEALQAMPDVTDVNVDLEGKKATVVANREIPKAEFAKVITDAGYELV
jgi:Cu+-exporting ATPase